MEIKKTHFDVAGPALQLTVPFAKVNEDKRIVSGFATLDNVDTQGDVVTAEASKEAFDKSRFNLRESHTNIAIGKVLNHREEEYYSADDDKVYRGIYVDAYISKGSPLVWEKVIDGTLQAFSIGGSVKESKSEIRKSADGKAHQVRVITKYDLTELSLCDAGANQLANVFSIQKVAGSDNTVVEGEIVNIDIRNVLYCKTDGVAIKTTLEKTDCTICSRPMENIGWFETAGDEENVAKVRQIVKSFKDSEEGGNEVADNEELHHGDNEEVNATVDSASAEDLPVEEATKTESDDQIVDVPAGAESTEPAEETTDEKSDEDKAEDEDKDTTDDEIVKTISEFQDKIKETLEKGQREHKEALEGLEDKFAKTVDAFETKFNELRADGEGLRKKFDELSGKVETVEKSLGQVAKTTASKKSGDLGGSASENTITKSSGGTWGGSIFSVDNL